MNKRYIFTPVLDENGEQVVGHIKKGQAGMANGCIVEYPYTYLEADYPIFTRTEEAMEGAGEFKVGDWVTCATDFRYKDIDAGRAYRVSAIDLGDNTMALVGCYYGCRIYPFTDFRLATPDEIAKAKEAQ